MPQVSVIIPTYNCSRYLPEALESVFSQSYEDFEVLIVDDGSIDNTTDVVSGLMRNWPKRIHYYYLEHNGVSAARNFGIKAGTGEYIAFLDADDVWLTDYLREMVSKIEEGYDWVVSDNFKQKIDLASGDVTTEIELRAIEEHWDKERLLKEFLIHDRIGGPSKVLVRKKVLIDRNISFDVRLRSREDWDFYLQLLENYCVLGWVKEPLYIYKTRNDNSNATRRMGWDLLDYSLLVNEKHKKKYSQCDLNWVLGEHYFALAREFFYKKKDLRKAASCLAKNIQLKGLDDLFHLLLKKMRLE
jgi:glycosyltransferase involved in cell wall biosynthesis